MAWGQGAVGTLNGTVLDAAGAVVPGAAVVAVNSGTAVESRTTSTSSGSYTLPYLPAGTYTIRVTAPGFRTASAENVILRVAQTLSVNINLELGQLSEQVTVSATPPLLESGTAEIGRYISESEYKSWPIMVGDGQRQIQDFIFTSLPGTTGDTFAGSINGGQQYSHEILIEGIPVGRADLSGGNNNEFSPSAESVGEFKLQSGAIGAQYNGGQTAVANFSIKSGTNELHGSGFLYLQNEAFNATPLSAKTNGNPKAKLREDNWGYSVGGPVYIPKIYNGKNKTFFFTSMEKDHRNSLEMSGYTTLPSEAFKNGDFSALFDPAYTGNALAGTQAGVDALGRPVIVGQIYDPTSTRRTASGDVVRDPFPNNQIPTAKISSVAKNVLDLGVPTPTYNSLVRNTDRTNGCCPFFDLRTFGFKVDHNISDRHRLSTYYNHEYRNRLNNSGGSAGRYLPIPGSLNSTWKNQYTPGRMARASLNSTLTPTMINRIGAGFNRFYNQNGGRPETIGQGWAEQLGIQNTSDAFFPTFTFSNAATEYQGSTLAQLGGGGLYPGANGSWVINDDLTWIKGAHSFHFGFQYTKYYYNERSYPGSGAFQFNSVQTNLPGFSTQTGNSFASFVLGAVDRASRDLPTLSSGFRQPQHAFYVVDDWKITPRLTMNIGLRWEIIPPFFERTGRQSYIDLDATNPGAGNLPGALVFGKKSSDTYYREFGPRLGFVYQLDNKTVFRAGYAMTNMPPIRNDWGYGGFTYGYNGAINVRRGSSDTGFVDDPSMYLSDVFPNFTGTLPNTDPASGNFDAYQTNAPDANRPGYTQNWNFTIQRELPGKTVLELAYVGNKGTRLWGGQGVFGEMNGLPSSMLAMGDVLRDSVANHPEYTPYAGFPSGDYSVSQALRPYPQYTSVQEAFPYNTNSNYNSLQITATRHLTTGLGFLAGYTWSKTLGYYDASGAGNYYGVVQDYYNRSLERSIAIFNYPRNFKLTWVYETPFGKGRRWDLGKLNYAVGGWELSAIHNYRSGAPLYVASSGLDIPAGFAPNIRPDIISGVPLTLGGAPTNVDLANGTPYLNPAAFQNVPATGNGVPLRVGSAPRIIDGLRGPHSLSESFRMAKKFPIKERATVGVEVTMTNPLNRTGRSMGSLTLGDSDFGTIYASGGGQRVIQLGARVEF